MLCKYLKLFFLIVTIPCFSQVKKIDSINSNIKQLIDSSIVKKTVDRSNLWRALTPQMFRLTVLQKALSMSIDNGTLVTDESQAIEQAGLSSKIIEGSSQNIKVTRPEDLWLAEAILSRYKSIEGN